MSQSESRQSFALGAISITGRDAAAFVQSQLTLDADSLPEDLLRPCAWCRPDGRVEAVLLVAHRGGRWWLVVPEPIVQSVGKRLRMFSIGREIELDLDQAAHPSDDEDAIELEYDRDRALRVEPGARRQALSAEWLRCDIDSAMPWLLHATQGEFLPQMLGLEALAGLSYSKGCYPGQEVIARVHYRGRVTRRTMRFHLDARRPPRPGAAADIDGERASVLYAVSAQTGGPVAGLAVVPADTPPGAALTIGSELATLVEG